MSENILNHHGRVIDKNTDGENKCEQTNAVNRVVNHHRPPDSDQDNDGDDRNNNKGRPKTETDQAQYGNDKRRFQHGTEQFINLVISRLAVVAGDRDIDI